MTDKPTIVCLCGSTRFYEHFQRVNYEETMAGRIVLTVGFYPHSQDQAHGETLGITEEQKAQLDELHLRKIDLADEVFVINVDRYVGDSTMSEIAYALWKTKSIRWLEKPLGGSDNWIFNHRHQLGILFAEHAGYPLPNRTVTLTDDIEGIGKAGEKVPLAKLLDLAATQSFEMGLENEK